MRARPAANALRTPALDLHPLGPSTMGAAIWEMIVYLRWLLWRGSAHSFPRDANQLLKKVLNARKCGKKLRKWCHCEPVRFPGVVTEGNALGAIPPSFRVLIDTFSL